MTTPTTTVHELATPVGLGRAHVRRPHAARGLLVLGHGAGPSITTVDLLAARDAALGEGFVVAVLEQPWLVAGGRVAARAPVLDRAWVAMVSGLVDLLPDPQRRAEGRPARGGGTLVVGGRSAGARVACRTAVELAADAVVCLSFPLHPPGKPLALRADELRMPVAAGLPVHVVQGERDPFGTPAQIQAHVPGLAGVHPVPGTHTIAQRAAGAVGAAVAQALRGIPER